MRYRAGWEPSEGDNGSSCWFHYGLHLERLSHLSHIKMRHVGVQLLLSPFREMLCIGSKENVISRLYSFCLFFFLFLSFFLCPWFAHHEASIPTVSWLAGAGAVSDLPNFSHDFSEPSGFQTGSSATICCSGCEWTGRSFWMLVETMPGCTTKSRGQLGPGHVLCAAGKNASKSPPVFAFH